MAADGDDSLGATDRHHPVVRESVAPIGRMKDYPYIRQFQSPLRADQLRPLDPRCTTVQFGSPLAPAEIRRVADFVARYPAVTLRVYGHDTVDDLEFLELFPSVRGVQVDVWTIGSLDGLRHLRPDLQYLGFGATKAKRISLRALERFAALRSLWLEGHTKDFEVVGALTSLRELSLRSITLPDLTPLLPLSNLISLEVKLGGTKDLGLVPSIGAIQYLELWMIRGLSDLGWLPHVGSLRYLFLQGLKHVARLPSLDSLPTLERVHIESMKGLGELQSIARAPALRELLVCRSLTASSKAGQPRRRSIR